jgi:hypothetical protein
LTSARVSFGEHEPPKPGAACRIIEPMQLSARDFLHIGADLLGEVLDLVDEVILMARKALARILISSAVRRAVNITGAWFSDTGNVQ